MTQDNPPECREMVSHTSVGRPHAIISSTGETRASQPETHSYLMNKHSEDFVTIDKGSGMLFPLMVMSKGSLWSGESRKWLQVWYDVVTLPIEKLTEQFIGVLCVQSYDVHFRVKARNPTLILGGLLLPTKEAVRPDFNIAKNSNYDFLYVRAIQGHSGGLLIAPELMNHVAIPFRWAEVMYHRGSSLNVNSIPSPKQDLSQVERTGKKDDKQQSSHH